MIRKAYKDFLAKRARQGGLASVIGLPYRYLHVRLSDLAKRPLGGPILGTVITNYSCVCDCAMCSMPAREKELRGRGLAPLTTKEFTRVLDDLAGLGVLGIGLTGGEPLLRDDLVELIRHAQGKGISTQLNTNGVLLDEPTVKCLVEASLGSVGVSLDSASPKVHDRLRGRQGTFDKAVRAIGAVAKAKTQSGATLRLKMISVLSRENLRDAIDLIALGEKLGVDGVELIPVQNFADQFEDRCPYGDPQWRNEAREVARQLSVMKRSGRRIDNSLRHLRLFGPALSGKANPLRCFAGYTTMVVDCFGEVYGCLPMANQGRSIGNVRDTPLAEIWRSDKYNRVRKEMAGCGACYLNCHAELSLLFQLGLGPLRPSERKSPLNTVD